jgi:hypothetical protein
MGGTKGHSAPHNACLTSAQRARLEADAVLVAETLLADETEAERPHPVTRAAQDDPKRSKQRSRGRSAPQRVG